MVRRNDRHWWMIRIYCVTVRWLQNIVTADWICLASCLSFQHVTLDGAAIILQAAHTLTWCTSYFHNQYSWLILLSAPVHNDFASCIWLFSVQHVTEKQTIRENWAKEKTTPEHLNILTRQRCFWFSTGSVFSACCRGL